MPLLQLLATGVRDGVSLFYLSAAATFYAVACAQAAMEVAGLCGGRLLQRGPVGHLEPAGLELADHPQFYLVPVGLSAILFAEVNRELGRDTVNAIRSVGLIVVYASLAVPIWQFESFGAWLTLLLASLLGVFAGIGLRLQTFLWLGLTTFVLDVVYEMGRVSLDYAFAKWAIMLVLGIVPGDVRGAQREEADRRPDARILRAGAQLGMIRRDEDPAIGSAHPHPPRTLAFRGRPPRPRSGRAGCQETSPRIRSENGNENGGRDGAGAEFLPSPRGGTRPHYDGVVHDRDGSPPISDCWERPAGCDDRGGRAGPGGQSGLGRSRRPARRPGPDRPPPSDCPRAPRDRGRGHPRPHVPPPGRGGRFSLSVEFVPQPRE